MRTCPRGPASLNSRKERFTAPNGKSVLADMPDPALNGPVDSAIDFSDKLANSNYTKRCFLRQTFRYFMGRPENLTDACALTSMEQAYDSSGGSFFNAVWRCLVRSSAKRRRRWLVQRVS
jgi:hypothetical protein